MKNKYQKIASLAIVPLSVLLLGAGISSCGGSQSSEETEVLVLDTLVEEEPFVETTTSSISTTTSTIPTTTQRAVETTTTTMETAIQQRDRLLAEAKAQREEEEEKRRIAEMPVLELSLSVRCAQEPSGFGERFGVPIWRNTQIQCGGSWRATIEAKGVFIICEINTGGLEHNIVSEKQQIVPDTQSTMIGTDYTWGFSVGTDFKLKTVDCKLFSCAPAICEPEATGRVFS